MPASSACRHTTQTPLHHLVADAVVVEAVHRERLALLEVLFVSSQPQAEHVGAKESARVDPELHEIRQRDLGRVDLGSP